MRLRTTGLKACSTASRRCILCRRCCAMSRSRRLVSFSWCLIGLANPGGRSSSGYPGAPAYSGVCLTFMSDGLRSMGSGNTWQYHGPSSRHASSLSPRHRPPLHGMSRGTRRRLRKTRCAVQPRRPGRRCGGAGSCLTHRPTDWISSAGSGCTLRQRERPSLLRSLRSSTAPTCASRLGRLPLERRTRLGALCTRHSRSDMDLTRSLSTTSS